jgi:hypothetical protein
MRKNATPPPLTVPHTWFSETLRLQMYQQAEQEIREGIQDTVVKAYPRLRLDVEIGESNFRWAVFLRYQEIIRERIRERYTLPNANG